jgi:hypothetical protein
MPGALRPVKVKSPRFIMPTSLALAASPIRRIVRLASRANILIGFGNASMFDPDEIAGAVAHVKRGGKSGPTVPDFSDPNRGLAFCCGTGIIP